MSHFSADEWVDFTHGLLSPANADGIQAMLDNGCGECNSSLRLWRIVSDSLSREQEYEPSHEAVQAVLDAYPVKTPWRWMASVALLGNIIFDSLNAPALAGVRSSTHGSRQLTVEAGSFIVDLQLEPDSSRKSVLLTGQILAAGESQVKINGAEVVLLSPESVMQKTKANALGEFSLDYARGQNLRLFIDIRGERAIGIVLPELENAQAGKARRIE